MELNKDESCVICSWCIGVIVKRAPGTKCNSKPNKNYAKVCFTWICPGKKCFMSKFLG